MQTLLDYTLKSMKEEDVEESEVAWVVFGAYSFGWPEFKKAASEITVPGSNFPIYERNFRIVGFGWTMVWHEYDDMTRWIFYRNTPPGPDNRPSLLYLIKSSGCESMWESAGDEDTNI